LIVAGLRAIGAEAAAQILDDAGKVFGPSGPPADHCRRVELLNALSDEQEQVVDDLFNSDFTGGDNIEMLGFLYAAEHRSDFRNCV
jgi:hypothetical protein